ncbi:MAG: sigma-70 family RNA polymerase sigma factor [Pirellulaceae bacterium]
MIDIEDREEKLTQRVREGDQRALAELFQRYRKRLERMVRMRMDSRLTSREDANDVLQEAFLDLSNRISSFAENPDLSAYVWIRLAVKDRVIAEHRKHIQAGKRDARREVSLNQVPDSNSSGGGLAAQLEQSETSVGGKVLKIEAQEILQVILQSMEEVDREIILMRTFEGLTNAEAAQALGLSPNGASSRYSRAMARLTREFNQFPGTNRLA